MWGQRDKRVPKMRPGDADWSRRCARLGGETGRRAVGTDHRRGWRLRCGVHTGEGRLRDHRWDSRSLSLAGRHAGCVTSRGWGVGSEPSPEPTGHSKSQGVPWTADHPLESRQGTR